MIFFNWSTFQFIIFLLAASEKFGHTYIEARMEKTGTEVDDESFEFIDQDTIIMVLRSGESWKPRDDTTSQVIINRIKNMLWSNYIQRNFLCIPFMTAASKICENKEYISKHFKRQWLKHHLSIIITCLKFITILGHMMMPCKINDITFQKFFGDMVFR